MKRKADESISIYAAGVLLKHLDAFELEIAGVQQAQDIEYIHRMRVASRRLRSALALFWEFLPQKKREEWQEQFRGITKALGAARDTDVQLEVLHEAVQNLPNPAFRPGIDRLLLRHKQRRTRLQSDILKALDALTISGTVADIRLKMSPRLARQEQVYLYSPALYRLGFDALTATLDAFLAYEPFILQPERIEELHAMRIAAKNLRYTLEALSPLYGEEGKVVLASLKNAQELLGEIHDSDVWVLYLPKFIEKERQWTLRYFGHTRIMSRLNPGINYFLKDRQDRREKMYAKFLAEWQVSKDDQIWPRLRQIIQTPFNLSQARQALDPPRAVEDAAVTLAPSTGSTPE